METVEFASEMEQKIQSLENLVASQSSRITELEAMVRFYEERFKLSQRHRFGSSSEASPNQLRFENYFNEAEDQAEPSSPEPVIEEITYKRQKRVGKRGEDLSGLPVERIEYELPESDRTCPECGDVMRDIGVTVRDELEIIPAKVIHKEHAVHAYGCENCGKNNASVPITRADAPTPLIKGSLASPSAVAHIATQKYVNGVPLYRQEKGFGYESVALSRQTISNWLVYCAQNYLAAIYMLLVAFLLKEDVLHADETTVQVLNEPNRAAQAKSYEWLYRTGACSAHPIVIYEYQETRGHGHPKAFLGKFSGYLHSDGYQAYHSLPPGIIAVGCWFHARQYWENLYKILPEGKRDGSNAECGLVYINLLFTLEDEFHDLPPEERFEKRLRYSKPVSDEFFDWIGSLRALPKSLLGEAINYALSQREYLENVYLDGRLEMSNNRAERSIKPFVQGRKAWLFSNTPNGAESSSIIYSIVETAKENSLIPYQYIKYLLEMLPSAKTDGMEALLPWSGSLPDYCRVAKKMSNAKPKRPRLKLTGKDGSLKRALVKLREKFNKKDELGVCT